MELCLQGNLDPTVLLAGNEAIRRESCELRHDGSVAMEDIGEW